MSREVIRHDDEHLYWDNPEQATVVLRNLYDADAGTYGSRTFAGVTVRRVSVDAESPEYEQLQTIEDGAVFLVPAVLIEGLPIEDSSTLQIGGELWQVKGRGRPVHYGSVLKHYRCVCFLQRG